MAVSSEAAFLFSAYFSIANTPIFVNRVRSFPFHAQRCFRVFNARARSSRKRFSKKSPHFCYASGSIFLKNLAHANPYTYKALETRTTDRRKTHIKKVEFARNRKITETQTSFLENPHIIKK